MDLALALKLAVVDRASGALAATQQRLQKVERSARSVGEAWQQTGEKVSAAAEKVAAVAEKSRAAIESIVGPALEVQDALARMAADVGPGLTNLSGTLEQVQRAAVDWSNAHANSAAEYIQTSKLMLQQGIAEKDVVEATNAALRVQAAVGGDAAAVARTLGVVYAQFGDKTRPAADELARLGDMLARTRQLFPTVDVAQLTDPLKDVSPIAKQLGVDLSQVAAALGGLNASGLQGGEAGAKLAGLMTGLSAGAAKVGVELKKTATGGLDLVATLAEIEKKFGKVENMSPQTKAALAAAFGPDTFNTMTLLLGQTDKLSDAQRAIAASAGTAANAQQRLEETMSAQAKIAGQQWDNLKVIIAAGLMPALVWLAAAAKSAVLWLQSFATAHPTLVKVAGTALVVVAAVTAILAPVLAAAGAFISFAGVVMAVVVPAFAAAASGALAFAAALLANPITWIVLALIAAAVLLYVYWEPISAFFLGVWRTIARGAAWAVGVVTAVWRAAYGAVAGIFEEVRAAFSVSFVGGIHKAMALLNPGAILARVFMAVLPVLAKAWEQVRAQAFAAGASIDAAVSAWWARVLKTLHGAGASARASLAAAWAGARDDLYAFGDGVVAWLEQTFVTGVEADLARVLTIVESFSLASAGEKIVDTLVAGMERAAAKPAEVMRGVVQQVRDYLPFSPAKVGPLRDLHRVKIVETLAQSVQPEPLTTAIAGVTAAALDGFASPVQAAAIPASVANRSPAGASSPGPAIVTINFNGALPDRSLVAELEAWIADPANVDRIGRAVSASQSRQDRARFDR